MPSGALLKIGDVPFTEAHDLQKAMAYELRQIEMTTTMDISAVIKDAVCTAIYSDKFNAALKTCFKRCLYNDSQISDDTFEPIEARGDYYNVCFEVTQEVTAPFVSGLLLKYEAISQKIAALK